ncbi:MAG: acyltransferase [Planctomycetes bacterium]|nr:acyltransferase [Planctomycetota bacterium]
MKKLIKIGCYGLALLIVLPFWLCFQLGSLMIGRQKAFSGWSQFFSLFPGLPGVYLRWAFYRLVLPRCGLDACIGFGTIFSHSTAAVGRSVYVGAFCCLGDVTLADDVLIGSHVSIANGGGQHGTDRLDIPMREQKGTWPPIAIGRDTWIGDRAVVLADVGEHCVIGAGSVVAKPIPDYAVAVGSPARILRYRNESSPRKTEAVACAE